MPFTESIKVVDVLIDDKDILSAIPSDVVVGKMFVGSNKKIEGGSLPVNPERANIELLNGEKFRVPYGVNPIPFNVVARPLSDSTVATALDVEILADKTAWVNGDKVTGAMPNVGAENVELAAGESHKTSEGYHNGTGVIKAKSLISQTNASVLPGDLKVGSNCWANGEFVEGTMPVIGAVGKTLTAGESFSISEGYHNGKGLISALDLKSQTTGNAFPNVIASGYSAWVNGEKVLGTMPSNPDKNIVLPMNGTYTIPNGYHSGRSTITQNVPSKPGMTIAPAKETQIIPVGDCFMEGDITVTGIDALNYQRLGTAVKDSTGVEVSNYTLSVVGNKASIILGVDNWHDNATFNIYKIVSDNITDTNGSIIGNFEFLVMIDWTDQTRHTYSVGSIIVTTSLQPETNAHVIEIEGISSGTVTVVEPFSAREFSDKK